MATPRKIINTRPKQQAQELSKAIAELGDISIEFPTIEIELTTPALNDFVLQAEPIFIFTSANAVPAVSSQLPEHKTVLAIGPGTAQELQSNSVAVDQLPTQFNSEGLLALPVLQDCAGRQIIIFCGANSRPLLKETLAQRGAKVYEIECYRRLLPEVSSTEIERLVQQDIHAILSTSQESLSNLFQLLGPSHRPWLQKANFVVITPAMQQWLQAQGHQGQVTIAKDATTTAVIQAICGVRYRQTF